MPRAGLTTEVLTRAAADLADEAGLEAVTLSALARRFDVKVASLYAHVAGADDLRLRVAMLSHTEIADATAEAVAGLAGREALHALADAYRDHARAHPGRSAAARLPLTPQQAAAGDGVRTSRLTAATLRGYGLDEAATVHAVRLVGSVLHGFVSLEASGGFGHSTPGAEESWRAAIDALDAALRHWPTTPLATPANPAPGADR
ncbi:TetR/AcrR family transcriptional regulator [Nocardioides bruguierae]|uniref:TetR/AcrR family transcriptional regulator n=1 Tax=Nocardioides bruguierae TaxID=2945102 RepID=UPI0020212A5B|nr:TetR-like C-terminal domain-containing protein [Nocardioides bruguierae]MCL8025359.1 TetR/AcrR family transcriptional regulator [Nocardioides bruguierae]